VAAAVVERLEVVDVDLDDRDLRALVARRLEHVVQRVVEAAVVERARQRVLAVEAVDPRLERADGAAERVDRAGQDADRVAAAPAQRRARAAGGDEQRGVREALDR